MREDPPLLRLEPERSALLSDRQSSLEYWLSNISTSMRLDELHLSFELVCEDEMLWDLLPVDFLRGEYRLYFERLHYPLDEWVPSEFLSQFSSESCSLMPSVFSFWHFCIIDICGLRYLPSLLLLKLYFTL